MITLPTPADPWIIAPLMVAGRGGLMQLTPRLGGMADAVEWRVDPFRGDLDAGMAVVRRPGVPVITTLRTELTDWEGEYAPAVRALLALGPDLLDVEAARPEAGELVTEARAAGVVPVVSAHLDHMPSDPGAHLTRLRELAGADGIAKLAVTAGEADLDALAHAGTAAARNGRVIVVGMGDEGIATRLDPARFGSCATFATVGPASAPGQLALGVVATALGRR